MKRAHAAKGCLVPHTRLAHIQYLQPKNKKGGSLGRRWVQAKSELSASKQAAVCQRSLSESWRAQGLVSRVASIHASVSRLRSSSCSNAHTAHSSGPKPPFGPLPEGETWQRSSDTPPGRTQQVAGATTEAAYTTRSVDTPAPQRVSSPPRPLARFGSGASAPCAPPSGRNARFPAALRPP